MTIKIDDALKGFDFSPWGGIEGFLEASKQGSQGNTVALKRAVPDLARAVDEASRQNRLEQGDLVLFCSFGGGFTWGSMLMQW